MADMLGGDEILFADQGGVGGAGGDDRVLTRAGDAGEAGPAELSLHRHAGHQHGRVRSIGFQGVVKAKPAVGQLCTSIRRFTRRGALADLHVLIRIANGSGRHRSGCRSCG